MRMVHVEVLYELFITLLLQSVKWSRTPLIGLTGEERRGEDDVPHPALAVDLCVEAARHVARHAAGQRVQDDGCRVDGAVAVHVEHSQQSHEDDSFCKEEAEWSDSKTVTEHIRLYQVSSCHVTLLVSTKIVAMGQCCSELVCSVFKQNNDTVLEYKKPICVCSPVARVRNWAPTPSMAHSRLLYGGNLKTSVCMIFQPLSPWSRSSQPPSSSTLYLQVREKSFHPGCNHVPE